jgi:hypothetical protein
MRHKLTVLLACACALAALVGATALRAETTPPPGDETTTTTTIEEYTDTTATPQVDVARIQRSIQRLRRDTWYWQSVMGVRRTRQLARTAIDPQQHLDAWRRLAARTKRRAQNPPHKREWLCIHRFEGAWSDPGAPYYGGLQMDIVFQRQYGRFLLRRKGTADHWSPREQMWTAEKALRAGRGFYPWPLTARWCGLI